MKISLNICHGMLIKFLIINAVWILLGNSPKVEDEVEEIKTLHIKEDEQTLHILIEEILHIALQVLISLYCSKEIEL